MGGGRAWPGFETTRRAEGSRRGRLAGGPPPTGAQSSTARNNSARGAAPVTGRCTRYGPLHPLRGAAPVTGRCTRYGALHPIRRGALPTDRVQHTQSQEQTRNLRDASQAAAPVGGGRAWPGFETTRRAEGSRRGRLAGGPPPTGAQSSTARNNSARAAAPVTGRCTRYGAQHPIRRGALPTDRVQRPESQEQTRNLRDAGQAAVPVGGGWAWPDNESTRRAEGSRRGRRAGGPTPTGASSSTALSRSSAAAQHTAISRHSTSRRRGHPRR